MNRIKAFCKNKRKGFTLVELIVVLVILAILAALLVPALTGYISRAKEKAVVSEARQLQMAAQTVIDEDYKDSDTFTGKTVTQATASLGDEIEKLAELDGIDGLTWSITVDSDGKITTGTYNNGITVTYTAGIGWEKQK